MTINFNPEHIQRRQGRPPDIPSAVLTEHEFLSYGPVF